MTAAEHLAAAVAELRTGSDLIDEDADLVTLAEVAHLLDVAKKVAEDARNLLHVPIASHMGEPTVHEGGFRVESHRGMTKRGCDSEALLGHLAALSVVDRKTGEVRSDADRFDAFYSLVLRCVPITRSLQWRINGLRDVGVKVSDWFEWEPGRTTVTVFVVDPEAGEAA